MTIETFLDNYYPKSKKNEIKEIKEKREGLIKGNIFKKNDDEYLRFFRNIYFNYKNINLDLNIMQNCYFKKIYEMNKKNFLGKDEAEIEHDLYTESKDKILKLEKLFDNNLAIENKMENVDIQNFLNFIDEYQVDINSEIDALNRILYEKPKTEDYISKLISEIKFFKETNKVKIISSGLLKVFDNFRVNKSKLYEEIETIFKDIEDKNKQKTLEYFKSKREFLKIDDKEDNYYKFFALFNKYPDSIIWLKKRILKLLK